MREEQYVSLKAQCQKARDRITHLEEHLREREATLADKEKVILSLRSNNRTLDNFRYAGAALKVVFSA